MMEKLLAQSTEAIFHYKFYEEISLIAPHLRILALPLAVLKDSVK